MATNTTLMSELGDIYAQRFYPRVTDQSLIAEALEACADTYFLLKQTKKAGGLKGELFLVWCRDRLQPGQAWSDTTVALWSPPPDRPVSVAFVITTFITTGIATVCIYKLCTGKISKDTTVPEIRWPKQVTLEQR